MTYTDPIFIDFRSPRNLAELSNYIGTEVIWLKRLVDPESRKSLFIRHIIQKRSTHRYREYRTVWQVHPSLADVYKSFGRRFDLFVRTVEPRFPQPSAYGYVRGRSTVDNARGHCGAPVILHADITDFFPSISRNRVKETFVRLGINGEVADILAEFVTIDGSLPLGLHPSPMLANIVCLNLDDRFDALADKYGCHYTRYADDITFSGKASVPDKEEIREILVGEDFRLSERKFRISKIGQAHYVTGLSVSDPRFPRAPRRMKRILRQELYYCKKYGVMQHLRRRGIDETLQKGINRLDGYVKYIAHIEKEVWPKLRTEWDGLLNDEGLEPSYESIAERDHRSVVIYVDETEIEYQDKKILAISLALTEDPDVISSTTAGVLRKHLIDPFSDGSKESLEKRKLHYTDATEDLRKAYVDKLAILPFRAYLAYGELKSNSDYEDRYLCLLKKILPHRLMACDRAYVCIIFEENDKVGRQKIKNLVDGLFDSLKKANNRRPSILDTKIGSKADYAGFSVPDFMLGVFRGYAISGLSMNNKTDRRQLFYERLRDKYRVILDADKDIVFSRKRSFVPWQ